nr:hypothetical protein [Tanacetum cinerariifolium]
KDWISDSDEDESEEMVLKSNNVQHKPDLTKSGIVPINTARQSSLRAATPVSAARPINTAASKPLGAPQDALKDQGYFDSGCSGHTTRNISYLTDFKEHDGGVLQMCDKKNNVLFTDTECFVLSPNFKLADESQVLLKVPRKNNMYSFDMKNTVPKKDLTCLLAKATNDESMLWHRRLGHINFKNINKLVKDNLVRGLPSKHFENDQTHIACLKGKQHKVSFKSKLQNSISQPLFMLYMNLFGPTSVNNIMHKKYYLVITDDFSRFTWNRIMNEFCEEKGIKREFSVARTPQQNEIAERRNMTLIKAARTMLADSKLPTTFWAEAVNTACYVQNRILVVKPYFKTPYELFKGRSPALSFMRPFGCHVSILNTLDQLGKFDGKSDEGIFVGYSTTSKAFRVYNIRTRKVKENLHITFLENKPMIAGGRPEWLFDIDAVTPPISGHPTSGQHHHQLPHPRHVHHATTTRSGAPSPPPTTAHHHPHLVIIINSITIATPPPPLDTHHTLVTTTTTADTPHQPPLRSTITTTGTT